MIGIGIQELSILRQYRRLLQTVKKNTQNPDFALIKKAFRFANNAHREQKRLSGEPFITHPLSVAQILAEQGLDSPVLAAALLHDVVEDTDYQEETITREFGSEVNSLVRAVTKISALKKKGAPEVSDNRMAQGKEMEAAENIRMMLFATAKDVRVILIKLADKLHNMRTIRYQHPDKSRRIANEVLTIYSSIAGRLGMYRIKSELEDLAFAVLLPDDYNQINNSIDHSRAETEKFIKNISKILQQRLLEIQIKARVEGRAKHIYSIHQKMLSQGKSLNEIYDLRGIRIIVQEIRDCYGALGIVHTLWSPIPGRFRDYVATPKINGYQSLHTTVVGPDGKPLEIQIRTFNMNELAEYGIAAHWIYKNETSLTSNTKLRWLMRLSNLTENANNTKEFIEDLRYELSPEEVYVFTPRGDIIDLPRGCTVLDFAFRIHTEIGLRCKGAMVNDRLVPLRTELKSGDRIEILTDNKPHPSPSWLRYIKSSSARQKLRGYFRKLHDEEEPKVAERKGNREVQAGVPEQKSLDGMQELRIRRRKTTDPQQVPIEVAGSTDIPVRYAGCCSPVPGDRIVGFITRGRGVTVHRADCSFLPKEKEDRSRIIDAAWEGLTEKYPVTIEIMAEDRQGLYMDLVSAITRTFTNILRAEAGIHSTHRGLMKARFMIEVEHIDHLREIMESLRVLNGVKSVVRIHEKQRPAPISGLFREQAGRASGPR